MKYFMTGLLLAIAAIASAEEQPSGNTVVLHQEVYVKGPAVHLSDIADIKGDAATVLGDIELIPAASPGRSRLLCCGPSSTIFARGRSVDGPGRPSAMHST